MCHHHHLHRDCCCGDSPLLKVLAVGALVYVGLKAFHHYQIYHRD
ncbi:hypothetical protein SPACI_011060 [Sporomusa acidovorans DSM 3132]|uniref:Uncharacterized protein n=1 Tax=Sporomusa acidovorans (strain ATCC 49682 / DSM 3132 / Mol) TaxID=1123286 RepID=A0ABZ3IZ05_SPOA4|nr:hypothetical protein SPACI_40460 [Sporomusa acidovorans DSM 3132]SDF23596.1 hypothetical protein SAMN04488499_10398 [Sporomusa acidovorans]